jgi:hypothetical protein
MQLGKALLKLCMRSNPKSIKRTPKSLRPYVLAIVSVDICGLAKFSSYIYFDQKLSIFNIQSLATQKVQSLLDCNQDMVYKFELLRKSCWMIDFPLF